MDSAKNILGKASIQQNNVEDGNRYEWAFRLESATGQELGKFNVRHDYENNQILSTPNSVEYGRHIKPSDDEWVELIEEANELPTDVGFASDDVVEIC